MATMHILGGELLLISNGDRVTVMFEKTGNLF
jgi:hypothetical protein